MSLLTDPARPGELFAIMGCFVGYKFQDAGIFRLARAGLQGWTARRIFDLPFAHRIEIVRRRTSRYLVAASLAEDKADPADWSKPGSVYAARLSEDSEPIGALTPILPGIHKNHGLLLTQFEGRSTLLVGGSEGLLAVDLEAPEPEWPARQVLAGETSEMAVLDVDNDGSEELVTIEPFHGNSLRVYTREPGGWKQRWEEPLELGHCILAGRLGGVPSVIVSNRAGSKDLALYQFISGSKPARVVIDKGVAAANMILVTVDGKEIIVSANQTAGEIAAYAAR